MLAETQTRLQAHFRSLSRERADLRYPVYALEHGIDVPQIELLRTALNHDLLREGSLKRRYWLVWIVMAAEIGYAYDGDEFWASFAGRIPNWARFGSRETIRDWFVEFANYYGGFRPTGRWAKHFNIIAWPIAHSILPRDLQGQFARRLFDLRHKLATSSGSSIEELGAILHDASGSTHSRFQDFLGQTELTARLLLALRDEDVQGVVHAIQPKTLSRIVTDLEERRAARDWLSEARKVLRDARTHGSALTTAQGSPAAANGQSIRVVESVTIVSRQSADGRWLLGFMLPRLDQLLASSGVPLATLNQTRIRLADVSDGWKPGRALLSMSRTEHPILSLKDLVGKSVLVLEKQIPALADIIENSLRIRGEPPWLLRVHEDGVARQVLGQYVRSSQTYIFVTGSSLPDGTGAHLGIEALNSDTTDACLYLLDVPPVLSAPQFRELSELQIGYSLRTRVEPIGLVARREGSGERITWLTTEVPLLRISTDHPIQELTIGIDQRPALRITAQTRREFIISLGHLSAGDHLISIGVVPTEKRLAVDPEHLQIEIRAPSPWKEGVRQKAGISAVVEPEDAALEGVLSAKALVRLIGPPERSTAIDALLYNLNGVPTKHVHLGSITSLADLKGLRRAIEKMRHEPLAEEVQESPRVDLVFRVEDLGAATVSFPKKVRPFRWKSTVLDRRRVVRLIDEAGGGNPVTIHRFDISFPDKKIEGDLAACLAGINANAPGFLIYATCGQERYSAIVSSPAATKLTALQDLGVPISLSPMSVLPKHIPRLLALLRAWGRPAQVLGPLSMLRKAEVCDAFKLRVASILCGSEWAERARRCCSLEDPVFERLRKDIGDSPGYGARLQSNDWRDIRAEETKIEFARLASVYKVCDDAILCDLALRAAFDPASIKSEVPDKGASDWERLAKLPTLSRGAYFAGLVTTLGGPREFGGAVT